MEILTIVLAALMGILSPVGFVADRVAENAIRDQLESAEELLVRIDNAPSYQFVQGRADRVRIAGRGIYPIEGVRIDTLEVETDPIALNPDDFSELERPLQSAIKLVFTEADLNQALQSDLLLEPLQGLNLGFAAGGSDTYDFVDPSLEFLGENRIRFQITLQNPETGEQNQILAESGIEVLSGRQFQLVDPAITVDGEPLPDQFVGLLTRGAGQVLDLRKLEDSGITARVLKLEMEGDRLTLVSFIRIDPDSPFLAE